MATPSTTDSSEPRTPSITAAFSAGADIAARRPLLALVPFLAGLLSIEQFERAARADTAFQLNFGFPSPVAGLWTFLNAPSPDGVTVFGYSGRAVRNQPELLATGFLLGGGGILLVGLLTAVYLGAIDDALANRATDHGDNLSRHAPVTLAFAVLQFLGLFVLVGVGFALLGAGSPGAGAVFLIPAIIGGMIALYLLTPGVYVGVAADLGPRAAFARGIAFALTADYLVFALAHAVVVAVVSVPLSAIGYAAGLPSLLLAAALAAPVGLALNAATMAFVRRQAADVGGPDGIPGPPGDGEGPTPAIRRVPEGGN
jgi:hypothetical protein